jgi:hypothetical protein
MPEHYDEIPFKSPFSMADVVPTGGPSLDSGGGFGNSALGGILAGAMGGLGAGAARPNTSSESRHNDMLDRLTGHLATNPFDNAHEAANLDLRKELAQRKGVAGLIDPNTFSKLGSTNENILGVNLTPEDIAAMTQEKYQKEGSGLLGQILQGVLGGAASFIPGL